MSHKAFIVKIDNVREIPGANTIQIAFVLGCQVIVSKDWKAGMTGVFFPEDLQLAHDFVSTNNLYRKAELNTDKDKKGFFEEKRRVRAQKFMKEKSEGFFCEIESLSYTDYPIKDLTIGDEFDELNGCKVCQKYISKKTRNAISGGNKSKKRKIAGFPPHVDTDQFRYYVDCIQKGSIISLHAKVHGSSARFSHQKTFIDLPYWKNTVNMMIPLFKYDKWEYLNGTRRVVLNDPDKEGFHGSEKWRFDILDQLKPSLQKNMVIYGEIVGWANDTTIMPIHHTDVLKNKEFVKKYGPDIIYKYNCLPGENRFIIYRIAMVNEEGFSIDFSVDQCDEWCFKNNFEYSKVLVESFKYDGNVEDLKDLVETYTERTSKLSEDWYDPSHIAEGVVVRVDYRGTSPRFYKNKSFAFKVMEGIAKEDELDMEEAS